LIRAVLFDYGGTLVRPKKTWKEMRPKAHRSVFTLLHGYDPKLSFRAFLELDESVFQKYSKLEADEDRDIPDIEKYREILPAMAADHGFRMLDVGPATVGRTGFIGTIGWFFFLSIFALRIRRNDAFYTMMDLFYFFLLFTSSAFYPLDSMPPWLRLLSFANPLTWQADFLRYASLGVGGGHRLVMEAGAFCAFTLASFWTAARELTRKD
jgi:hypothetical protein